MKLRRNSSFLRIDKNATSTSKEEQTGGVKFGPKDFELLEFVGEVRTFNQFEREGQRGIS